MRLLVLACGSALALAAGNTNKGNDQANAEMNDLNVTDPNAANMMMTHDHAAVANGAGAMDMNTATSAATKNATDEDMKATDKDSNLSNGM